MIAGMIAAPARIPTKTPSLIIKGVFSTILTQSSSNSSSNNTNSSSNSRSSSSSREIRERETDIHQRRQRETGKGQGHRQRVRQKAPQIETCSNKCSSSSSRPYTKLGSIKVKTMGGRTIPNKHPTIIGCDKTPSPSPPPPSPPPPPPSPPPPPPATATATATNKAGSCLSAGPHVNPKP